MVSVSKFNKMHYLVKGGFDRARRIARPCVTARYRALLGLGWGKVRGRGVLALQTQIPRFSLFSTTIDPDIIKLTSGTGSRFANHCKSLLGFVETYKN